MQFNNNSSIAEKIIKRYETLFSNRATWESHWKEIEEVVAPSPTRFGGNTPTPGQKKTEKSFDSTATIALNRFAAAMESMLTPRTQRWHSLKPTQINLRENDEAKRYCETLVDILFSVRYSPRANFASQVYEFYRSVGRFGTGALFVDEQIGDSIRYKAIHLSEIYVAENSYGYIDTVFRKFKYTAYQAKHAFGEEVLPDQIKNALASNPDATFDFIHGVYPNEDYNKNKLDPKAMKYKSCYICMESKTIVREGGYRTLPYMVGRYTKESDEIYGRSPAMDVLKDIKVCNEGIKIIFRAGRLQAEPPLLMPEDGALRPFALAPGALNFGGLGKDGRQNVIPLQINANLGIIKELVNEARQVVNDAFLVSLFQILVDSPQMTATEVMYRQQEKGGLLAPTMGRQQTELLNPMIERELDILANANVLPPMPEILLRNGGRIDVEYDSPLVRAQRSEEGVAILNTVQNLISMAQIDPSVLKTFDLEKAIRKLCEINGTPLSVLRSAEEIQQLKEQEKQQQNMGDMLNAAPVLAQTSKTFAETQNIANQAGSAIVR